MDVSNLKEVTHMDPNLGIQEGLEAIASGLGFDIVRATDISKFTDIEFTFQTKTDRWTAYSQDVDGNYVCAIVKKQFQV